MPSRLHTSISSCAEARVCALLVELAVSSRCCDVAWGREQTAQPLADLPAGSNCRRIAALLWQVVKLAHPTHVRLGTTSVLACSAGCPVISA